MKWISAPLKELAPARASNIEFQPDELVWNLTLDQIESQTGQIINKKILPASEAGSSTYNFDDKNVLYSKLRPYLNKVISPEEPGIASSELVPLRPKAEVLDRQFLKYYLRSNLFLNFANINVAGVKMPRIIMEKFWEHEIPLPPLSEQRRIVEILDKADEVRRKRADADAKTDKILPSLFCKMFGIPATSTKYPNKTLIKDLIVSIKRYDPSNEPDKTFKYIDISGVDGQKGIISEIKIILGSDAPSRARQIVKTNDIIISTVRPYLRATALVPQELDKQICSTGFCVLRSKTNYGFGLLYGLSRMQWFTDQLNARARGASYPAVSDNDILNVRVPVSDNPEMLHKFDAQILDYLALQRKRQESALKIETIFSSLLHRAFSGDLTAKWRESHMKELLSEMEMQKINLRLN